MLLGCTLLSWVACYRTPLLPTSGCVLTISPERLDFGKVILNTSASRAITLVNQDTEACQVSGIAFGPGTDPGFTFDPGQALAFTVAPGTQQSVSEVSARSTARHRTFAPGPWVLQTGDWRAPDGVHPADSHHRHRLQRGQPVDLHRRWGQRHVLALRSSDLDLHRHRCAELPDG